MIELLNIGNAATWASYANKIINVFHTHTSFKKISPSILVCFTVSGSSLAVSTMMKRESEQLWCKYFDVFFLVRRLLFYFILFLWSGPSRWHIIPPLFSPAALPHQSTISCPINWSKTCCSSICSIYTEAKVDPLLVWSDHAFQPPPSPTAFIDSPSSLRPHYENDDASASLLPVTTWTSNRVNNRAICSSTCLIGV